MLCILDKGSQEFYIFASIRTIRTANSSNKTLTIHENRFSLHRPVVINNNDI